MIICCGEALIDMIPSPASEGPTSYTPHVGGAVFNTAIALGRLGVKTGFISGISRDLFGDMLKQALAESHVGTDHVIMSNQPSTLAFVQLVEGSATYHFFDESSAGRMLTPEMTPEIPEEVSTLYFGGISLINMPAADFYVDLAIREAGRRVIVADPNIRANFIHNEAAYRARLERLIAHVDVLKVSDEDLHWIIPGEGSLVEKAAKLREAGPALIVVTRGRDGSTGVFGDNQVIEAPARVVKVADTVGAGDTFNAEVVASLYNNGVLTKEALRNPKPEDIAAALAHGTAVAAITISRHGANPPWAHELESAAS